MNSPNRRKVCEIEIQKQTYLRHINRLEQLRNGKSPQQAKRYQQQKKLVETINTVRKMHTKSRVYRWKQKKQLQKQTKQVNFNKVKSVVLNDFNWLIPMIAPKHKRNTNNILNQNLQMFKRIINTKSNVDSTNDQYSERKQKYLLPCISSLDFSKIYKASNLNKNLGNNNEIKTIKLRFGKAKKYVKIKLQINLGQLFEFVKDINTIYYIQAHYDSFKCKSSTFILEELYVMSIVAKFPDKYFHPGNILIKLIKVLDCFNQKQICKAKLYGIINEDCVQDCQITPQQKNIHINKSYNTTGHTPRNLSLEQAQENQNLKTVMLKLEKQPKFIAIGRIFNEQTKKQKNYLR